MGSSTRLLVKTNKQTKEINHHFCKAVKSQPFSLDPELHLKRKMTEGFVHKFIRYRKYLWKLKWNADVCQKYIYLLPISIDTETVFDGENYIWFCSQVHKIQKIPFVADLECRCL